jgi:hypothetical protein
MLISLSGADLHQVIRGFEEEGEEAGERGKKLVTLHIFSFRCRH